MIKLVGLLTTFFFIGCGYSSVNNEVVGQIKSIVNNTPMLCPDYVTVNISLGVMKNNTGSVSKEDMVLYVPDAKELEILKSALASANLIRIRYNQKRVNWCRDIQSVVVSVELIKS